MEGTTAPVKMDTLEMDIIAQACVLSAVYVWVIDQARGQDGWPSSFFCVFIDRDAVEVHKLANKVRDQYWSIKD